MASVVDGRVKDVGYARRLARRQLLYVSLNTLKSFYMGLFCIVTTISRNPSLIVCNFITLIASTCIRITSVGYSPTIVQGRLANLRLNIFTCS